MLKSKSKSRTQKKSKITQKASTSTSLRQSTAKYQKTLGDLSHEAVDRDREINGDDEDYTPSVDHSIYYHSYDHYNYG